MTNNHKWLKQRYPLTHSLHISNYNPIHESGRPAYTIHNLPIVPNSSLLLFDPITSVVFSGLIKQLTMLASRLVPIRTAQPIGPSLEAVAVAPLFFDDEQLFDNPIDTLHWLVIGVLCIPVLLSTWFRVFCWALHILYRYHVAV